MLNRQEKIATKDWSDGFPKQRACAQQSSKTFCHVEPKPTRNNRYILSTVIQQSGRDGLDQRLLFRHGTRAFFHGLLAENKNQNVSKVFMGFMDDVPLSKTPAGCQCKVHRRGIVGELKSVHI